MVYENDDRIAPPGPTKEDRHQPDEINHSPSLRSFVTGRVISGNGLAAAAYFGLSIWVWLNPARARRLWRSLGG